MAPVLRNFYHGRFGMTRSAMYLRKALFASVTALALGFGAAQAFAAPAPAADEKALYCSEFSCNYDCRRRGYSGGFCGAISCSCYY